MFNDNINTVESTPYIIILAKNTTYVLVNRWEARDRHSDPRLSRPQ